MSVSYDRAVWFFDMVNEKIAHECSCCLKATSTNAVQHHWSVFADIMRVGEQP
jgi:hypothetical protein